MADKLNWKGLATAGAVFWGVYLGLAAWVAMANLQLPWFSKEMFSMLAGIYPGVTPTGAGILIGLVWGAVCGGICGGILAGLYNWSSKMWK
ncbi:hypothetical protein HY639_04600 [Candidatus Woesearchaeota archaeon]|nr:hypothetical protein [Candidatus Woesearchaeota archaeon]